MLVLVPTPIGNLEDMTFRAIRMLKEADFILAEDTRNTGKLLKHYGITTPMQPYHAHNEHKILPNLVEKIEDSKLVCLVTDAGSPGISDPGFLLVRECLKKQIEIDSLPGATAFVPALAMSGLPTDKFYFEGFLPHQKGRQKRFQFLAGLDCTLIIYESPYRVIKSLEQMIEFLGADTQVAASREITKFYQETIRGTATAVLAHFNTKEPKGEFVIVFRKNTNKGDSEKDQ